MNEQELYIKIYDQVLDYADDEIIARCARWGYAVEQKLTQHNRVLVQTGAEESSTFIYAIATAVVVGEFAKRAYNDHFLDEAGIDLDLLDMDFEQIRGFIEKDITKDRLNFLEGGNSIGLQDMWTTISEWKQEIHKSLVYIYRHEKGDPNDLIFNSLVKIFERRPVPIVTARRLDAYSYISNSFQI